MFDTVGRENATSKGRRCWPFAFAVHFRLCEEGGAPAGCVWRYESLKGCDKLVEGHAAVLTDVASADPRVHADAGRRRERDVLVGALEGVLRTADACATSGTGIMFHVHRVPAIHVLVVKTEMYTCGVAIV